MQSKWTAVCSIEENDMLKVQAADSRSRAVFGSQVKQAKERQQLNPFRADTGSEVIKRWEDDWAALGVIFLREEAVTARRVCQTLRT